MLSGLVLWKSVQFPLLRELLGGYELARRIHFVAMATLVAFVAGHPTHYPRALAKGPCLAVFAKICWHLVMSTMNISLPDALKSFVDEQVIGRGFGSSSEYVRELIRKDQERLLLRGLLLAGASSNAAAPADTAYFVGLRDRISNRRPS